VPADAAGHVVLKDGGAALDTATVVSRRAGFTLSGLAAGEHALVASYSGDGNHEAASGLARVTVTAAPGTADEPVRGIAKVTWGTKPTAGRRGTAVVRVSPLATGKAKVVVRSAKGRKVTGLSVRIRNGKVRARLPRLARGTYTLVVKVPGNASVGTAKVSRTFRVK